MKFLGLIFWTFQNDLMSQSTSSQESVSKLQKVKPKKVDVFQGMFEKEKIKVKSLPLNDFISMHKTNEIDLIDKIKTKILCDEQYDENWYIDSGCPCHMAGRKENLRGFRKLVNVEAVTFGNHHKCKVKGYGKVMNGKFTVNRVAYVEVLKHILISVSQLVVGTRKQMFFDEEGSISNKEIKDVLLKSKMKGGMFTLDMKPIIGIPSICQILKASSDLSWL
ncbi:uncharacterized protein LOC111895607 [Lactuca sativa]|uniref:uncharacterized protein LOC111895607 n=1 Tax=Lactuca sativa TaxID=4236 RepID=UPI000CD887B9|nr:uncharacterized protein LOC111895607 [Lactuca sativa]